MMKRFFKYIIGFFATIISGFIPGLTLILTIGAIALFDGWKGIVIPIIVFVSGFFIGYIVESFVKR